MVSFSKPISAVAVIGLFLNLLLAHPGHDHHAEAQKRAAQIQTSSKHSLAHCADALKERGHVERALARRSEWAEELRARNFIETMPFLKARDLDPLNISHASHLTGLAANATDGELFGDNEGGCVLQPEVTEGPYFVSGELIRSNVVEHQGGIPLYADMQFLDMTTCEPLTHVWVDWWQCNSTGVYGGVSAAGNGDSDTDTSNLNATFLRGIQSTDLNGVVRIESIFPGHYAGRTAHVHVLVHERNITIDVNKTIQDSSGMHVGQFFFDQDLISAVEATFPYHTNTQPLTTNEEDEYLATEAASSDPMMEYVLLGDKISDGILAWISIGVNTSYSYDVWVAATLTANGGVED
ncbi:putative dioxygenase [Rhizodiscina lignyota]|uniref:Dioxygenase n=1 Tax=Rhizodiscina lignyota TaxID=1504668 RepID=A0A9P4LZH0_9PEZI|nr:putative dioxygenase [Rhizodiscina lignyota]